MGEKKRRIAAAKTGANDAAQQAIAQAIGLLRSGRRSEARAIFIRLQETPVFDPDALHHLAYLAIGLDRPARAAELLRQAIALDAGAVSYHNTLAIAFRRLGRFDDAIEELRRAIALDPDLHEAYHNIGNVFRAEGRYAEAAASYRRALQLAPEIGAYWSAFAESLSRAAGRPDPRLRQDLLAALAHPEVDPKSLVRPVLALLSDGPAFARLIRKFGAGDLSEASPLIDPQARAALEDPLLLRLLEATLVDDPAVERLLTCVRRALLCDAASDTLVLPLSLEFICALARHSFSTEYAWQETEPELVTALEARVRQKLVSPDDQLERSIAILAAYRPLHLYPEAGALDGRCSAALQALLKQQWIEPADELRLQSQIPAIHPIDDPVSLAVQNQYEVNPYPRWVRLGRFDHALPLRLVLQELFPRKRVEPLPTGVLNVLIAGCGTGDHPIRSALRFENARVVAVDLSRVSLAYALRKTRELSIENIEYLQGDILRLRDFGRRFDLVECVGVLHHLRDPLAGWRELLGLLSPNGFMRIGLYSELARKHVVHARKFAEQGGFSASTADLRRLRQAIFGAAGQDPALNKITRALDFYSLSGCRDLLLHVEEHRFTLPRIAATLQELGLEFLGFELPGPEIAQRYLARFPSNPAMDDLPAWDAFEHAEPDTFFGMYQFWARRAPK